MNTSSDQTPELAPGIHRIDLGASNAYLVVDETTNRAVLIDPGAEPDVCISMWIREGKDSVRPAGRAVSRLARESD